MEIYTDINSLSERLRNETSIALIPTMGNLHQGHLSLITAAKPQAKCTVVSIFINKLQFLPHEDLDQYPRSLENDCLSLKEHQVDILFAPNEATIYPKKQEFLLTLPNTANTLEGEFRPGFFTGVATIVLKLFNIIHPQVAIFGKKDYQQFHILREMVKQLNLPIKMLAYETIRCHDGLARSSRNQYLDVQQRKEASYLYQTLNQIKQDIKEQNNKNFKKLEDDAIKFLQQRGWKVDYIALQQRNTLNPATINDDQLIVMAAAWLGNTRLIDNLEI